MRFKIVDSQQQVNEAIELLERTGTDQDIITVLEMIAAVNEHLTDRLMKQQERIEALEVMAQQWANLRTRIGWLERNDWKGNDNG